MLGAAGEAIFSDGKLVNFVRPSIDVLMESVRPSTFQKIAGIILTGMGCDGAKGLRHLKALGALTLAQDEASSVIFGMPKAAIDLGSASEVLPIDRIAGRLADFVRSV